MSLARTSSLAPRPSGWAWALTGACIGALTALLMHWPALWLGSSLSQVTKGQVQLQEAQGSVWQGSAKLVLTGGEGSRDAMALPGRIEWQLSFSPQGLGLPILNLQLLAPCCMAQPARVQINAQLGKATWHLQMNDHRSQWPAHLLSGLGAPWNTLQPEGNLNLVTEQLQLDVQPGQTVMQGRMVLTAENMSSKLSTLRPMGTYQVSLGKLGHAGNDTAVASPPALALSTLSGSLLLSGQGQWQSNRLQFRGEASAVPEHAAALSNLLNIIGRRQGARSLLSLG